MVGGGFEAGAVGGGFEAGFGAIGGGFAAGFGTAGFSFSPSVPAAVLASCCCLSLCFSQGGLLSSPVGELRPSGPDSFATGGFDGTVGRDSLVESSFSTFRLTQGGILSSSPSFTGSFAGTGTFGLRSWLAHGATCALSSSFFSPIFVSRSMMAEVLPVRCRAFFMISDMSIPPPPPPLPLTGGGGLPGLGFIVAAFAAFPGF